MNLSFGEAENTPRFSSLVCAVPVLIPIQTSILGIK